MSATTTAFTIGLASSYDAALAADRVGPVTKCGKDAGYRGGIVWRTPTGAQVWLASSKFQKEFPDHEPRDFAVYRLELPTNWDTDVDVDFWGTGHLLHDAIIVERWEEKIDG